MEIRNFCLPISITSDVYGFIRNKYFLTLCKCVTINKLRSTSTLVHFNTASNRNFIVIPLCKAVKVKDFDVGDRGALSA